MDAGDVSSSLHGRPHPESGESPTQFSLDGGRTASRDAGAISRIDRTNGVDQR
jgi:hypothetical protein